MNKITFLLIFLAFGVLQINAQSWKSNIDSLDKYFEKSRAQWDVPGLAVGIIKNDSLIFAKGYGYSNIKKKEKVNPQTIFPIASNTKAFTAASIAILVDEGKLSWDTKVVEILPYFQLYDPFVTEHFTIADMLSHRSGLKTFSGDLLWYGTDYTREAVVRKLHLLKPAYEFRTTFGYSNIMYIAAGEIIAKVSGMSYEEFLNKHFFQPLGMKRTYTSIDDLKDVDNVCTPYNKVNDEVFPIELLNWDNIGGAGILNSDIEDMSKWVKLQLNNGIWHNDTIFTPTQATQMRTPHTNFTVREGAKRYWPSTHFKAYGMGWSLEDYHGKLVVSHSGGYDGVITYTCLVPEEKLGFIILTNSTNSLYNALSYRILDNFLAKDTIDWASLFLPYQQRAEKKTPINIPENAVEPSYKLKDYAGVYKSELYGNAAITVKGRKMKVNLLHTVLWEGEISKYNADTFIVEFTKVPPLPQGFITFTIDKSNNKIKSFVIDVPNPDFDFTEFEFKKLDWIEMPKEEEK
jgi:CubicO group peptidase (beta-lactamase class C family)